MSDSAASGPEAVDGGVGEVPAAGGPEWAGGAGEVPAAGGPEWAGGAGGDHAVSGPDLDADDDGSAVDDDAGELTDEDDADATPRRAPWHFKIILVGTVIYLGYRAYQGIGWVIHHV